MPGLVTYFDPPPGPGPGERPARLPSPFDPGPPHPLARRAAETLMAALARGEPVARDAFDGQGRGKMFGVLVVADAAGRVGWLRGFSGMLAGSWHAPGFVPPLFDEAQRDAFWPAGEAELLAFDAALAALAEGAAARALHADSAALAARHAAELAALDARHATRRRERHAARAQGADAATLHALAQASRGDGAELRRLRATHDAERAALAAQKAAHDGERARLEAARAARSRELLVRLYDGYTLVSARGEARALRAIFAPEMPPGGAGDCAAPKLLGHARRAGLTPLALAEFWWGAPPATGGRHEGVYYPACRGKCGPILPHLLDGLDVEAAPIFGAGRVADDEPRAVFDDAWLLVVDKPVGLLSVPGRSGQLRDSVQTRLRRRLPGATGPLVVHRLDLDTSGLLLAAKDDDTHAALARAFARREIDKRYVAWLDGDVAGDAGVVDLALRVDLDDRPRQIHDAVHGKPATTAWRVLARAGGRTRVELRPETGRTHQLRVHAAHPLGLGAPIVGDRLYGIAPPRDGERLLLHAESLGFVHPRTGERVEVRSPAPF